MGKHVGNSNKIIEIEILIEVLEDNVNKICQKTGKKMHSRNVCVAPYPAGRSHAVLKIVGITDTRKRRKYPKGRNQLQQRTITGLQKGHGHRRKMIPESDNSTDFLTESSASNWQDQKCALRSDFCIITERPTK